MNQKTIAFFPEAAFGPALNSVGIAQAVEARGGRRGCPAGRLLPIPACGHDASRSVQPLQYSEARLTPSANSTATRAPSGSPFDIRSTSAGSVLTARNRRPSAPVRPTMMPVRTGQS